MITQANLKWSLSLFLKLLILWVLLFSLNSYAGIQNYQVVRLIAMKSDCNRSSLKRVDKANGTVVFFSECSNVSHYPDGLTVMCVDPDNEQSCKVQTQAKQFDYLKMLQE